MLPQLIGSDVVKSGWESRDVMTAPPMAGVGLRLPVRIPLRAKGGAGRQTERALCGSVGDTCVSILLISDVGEVGVGEL